MKPLRRLGAVLPLLSLFLFACASEVDAPPSGETDDPPSDEQEIASAITIAESQNGSTLKVPLGKAFAIRLGENKGSTGFRWVVASAPTELGAPKESYTPAGQPGQIGSGGTKTFAWKKTTAPGKHRIALELVQPWNATKPARKFAVTVEVTP